MGTQKNRLNETVLLSTQNTCSIDGLENNYNFRLIKFPYLDLWFNLLSFSVFSAAICDLRSAICDSRSAISYFLFPYLVLLFVTRDLRFLTFFFSI